MTNCMYKECSKPVHSRGLCNNHYTYAAFHVRHGVLTWEELIKRGKCLGVNRKGKMSPFLDWLLEESND